MPYLLLQSKIWKCVWVIQIYSWEKTQFGLSHQLKKGRLVSKQLVYYTTNTKSLFHRGLCLSGKNLDQNPLPRQNRIVTIFWKRVLKQAVGEGGGEI